MHAVAHLARSCGLLQHSVSLLLLTTITGNTLATVSDLIQLHNRIYPYRTLIYLVRHTLKQDAFLSSPFNTLHVYICKHEINYDNKSIKPVQDVLMFNPMLFSSLSMPCCYWTQLNKLFKTSQLPSLNLRTVNKNSVRGKRMHN